MLENHDQIQSKQPVYTTKGRREGIAKRKPVNDFHNIEAKGSLGSIFKSSMTFVGRVAKRSLPNMHTNF